MTFRQSFLDLTWYFSALFIFFWESNNLLAMAPHILTRIYSWDGVIDRNQINLLQLYEQFSRQDPQGEREGWEVHNWHSTAKGITVCLQTRDQGIGLLPVIHVNFSSGKTRGKAGTIILEYVLPRSLNLGIQESRTIQASSITDGWTSDKDPSRIWVATGVANHQQWVCCVGRGLASLKDN